MEITAFDEALARATLFFIAISIAGTLITIYVAYAVLKAAIRDGIKESGLVRTWAMHVAASEHNTEGLPEMRADR